MTTINSPEECLAYANYLGGLAIAPVFTPFTIKTNIDNTRTLAQNRYYWGVVVASQVKHFTKHLGHYQKYVLRAIAVADPDRNLTHAANRVLHNGGASSTELNTFDFLEKFANPIREDMLHNCGVDIPLPEDGELLAAFEHYKQAEKETA